MANWYDSIIKIFNGNHIRTYEEVQDGETIQTMSVLVNDHDINVVRYNHDNNSVVVGVDGWVSNPCSLRDASDVIYRRIDLYG